MGVPPPRGLNTPQNKVCLPFTCANRSVHGLGKRYVKVRTGKHEFPFGISRPENTDQIFRCSQKFSDETIQKVVFHLLSNRIFRKILVNSVNGKQPRFPAIIFSHPTFSTVDYSSDIFTCFKVINAFKRQKSWIEPPKTLDIFSFGYTTNGVWICKQHHRMMLKSFQIFFSKHRILKIARFFRHVKMMRTPCRFSSLKILRYHDPSLHVFTKQFLLSCSALCLIFRS